MLFWDPTQVQYFKLHFGNNQFQLFAKNLLQKGQIILKGNWGLQDCKKHMIFINSLIIHYKSSPYGYGLAWPCPRDIYNNIWLALNNDFLVLSEAICQWFNRCHSHEWKSFANCSTSDLKKFIHGKSCIIPFCKCYFMSWTCKLYQNNHQSLVSPLLTRMAFHNLALWHCHCCCDINQLRGYKYHNLILVDYSCMWKWVQNWYSLMNKNRDYWFPDTQ